MRAWVIMGNDYPDAVFLSAAEADAYVAAAKREQEAMRDDDCRKRIYWRHYEFEISGGEQ
jgi:hypothetical protein